MFHVALGVCQLTMINQIPEGKEEKDGYKAPELLTYG